MLFTAFCSLYCRSNHTDMNCSSFTAVFRVQTTEDTTLKKQKLTVLFDLLLTQPDLQV